VPSSGSAVLPCRGLGNLKIEININALLVKRTLMKANRVKGGHCQNLHFEININGTNNVIFCYISLKMSKEYA
jgi:hypothetical protein